MQVEKHFLLVRKITVPPVFAAVFLLVLYGLRPSAFASAWQLLGGIFFLGLLPVLGYPLQKYIPFFQRKGREGQRSLAMLFSLAGYLLGTVIAFAANAPAELCTVYLEYLLCGVSMLVCNLLFHWKASGHACGITAPVLLFARFHMFVPAAIGALLVVPVLLSSLRTGRHTKLQLLGGCLIPAVCLAVILCFG